jgi:hypothetical protein
MGDIRILFGKDILSLWKILLVIPMLFILSNCAYAPDLLPGGAPVIAEFPGVRAMIGKSDLAIVITVKDTKVAQDVPFHWNRKGALIWGERPGNTAAIWRFVLIAPGVKEPICKTAWMKSEATSTTCNFNTKDYFGMPLLGELDFFLDGENPGGQLKGEEPGPNDPLYRISTRVHYLVHGLPELLKDK